jgi:hypothetical protein
MQNFLQPVLTTGPAVGIGPTLAGMKEMAGRVRLYARETGAEYTKLKLLGGNPMSRLNQAAETGFSRAFPELMRSGLRVDPRLFESEAFAERGAMIGSKFRRAEDFYRFLLQPFTHAEISNQATTFFAGRHAIRNALRTGEMEVPVGIGGKALAGTALDDWINFNATEIVGTTQFRPGPGSRTIWQGSVPGPLKMFTTFPTRALSFMLESTVRGAMTEQQLQGSNILHRMIGGRNLGTLSRMVLYGKIVNNAARDALNIDLSHALGLTAPFMVAPPSQMFAPLPIPPVASVVTGLVSAGINRDLRQMQPLVLPHVGEIPLPKVLFPGGVMMSRIGRALNQWRPDLGGFADENEKLLYRGNSYDLTLAMLGIPIEKQRRLRGKLERIQSLRQRIRDYRREFSIAAVKHDYPKMGEIRGRYADSFPDLPPLSVSSRDVERYRENMRIPLVQRMVNSMGKVGPYVMEDLLPHDADLIFTP